MVFKMVGIFGFRFGEVALEEEFLFVAIMGTTFRGSVVCGGIISQNLSWSLRSRRILVIVGG